MNLLEIENKAVSALYGLLKKYKMKPLELSMHTMITPARLSEIFANKRRITADSDLRLTTFFKLKRGYFLKLQIDYDLDLKESQIADSLEKIKNIDEVIRAHGADI